jgi:hypothetical protein
MSALPDTPKGDASPHFSWRRSRFWIAGVILLLLLVAYVGSYLHLSRRGMREAKPLNMPGFFYVPFEEIAEDPSLSRHYTLVQLYAPLSWLDQKLLGSKGPVQGITWGLSK